MAKVAGCVGLGPSRYREMGGAKGGVRLGQQQRRKELPMRGPAAVSHSPTMESLKLNESGEQGDQKYRSVS